MKFYDLLVKKLDTNGSLKNILNKYWMLFKPAPDAEKPTKEAMQFAIAFTIGQLYATPRIDSTWKIIFQYHEDDLFDDDAEPWWSVELQDDKDEVWAADFTDWAELLDMEVVIPPTMDEMTALCEILYEITFYGFTNKSVQERKANLYDE